LRLCQRYQRFFLPLGRVLIDHRQEFGQRFIVLSGPTSTAERPHAFVWSLKTQPDSRQLVALLA